MGSLFGESRSMLLRNLRHPNHYVLTCGATCQCLVRTRSFGQQRLKVVHAYIQDFTGVDMHRLTFWGNCNERVLVTPSKIRRVLSVGIGVPKILS